MFSWLTSIFPLDWITTPIANGYERFMRLFRTKKGKYGGEFKFPERSEEDVRAFFHDAKVAGIKMEHADLTRHVLSGPSIYVYFPDSENLKTFIYLYEHRQWINP